MLLPVMASRVALSLIDRTAGTNIGNLTASGGLVAAFDGETSEASPDCAGLNTSQSGFVGKTLASAEIFGQAIAYGSNNVGFGGGATPTITLTIYGKDGVAPAAADDGTIIGTLAPFLDTPDESGGRVIQSSDIVNTWDHIWLRVQSSEVVNFRVAELVLFAVP